MASKSDVRSSKGIIIIKMLQSQLVSICVWTRACASDVLLVFHI